MQKSLIVLIPDWRFGSLEKLNDIDNTFLDHFVQLLLHRSDKFNIRKHVLSNKKIAANFWLYLY